MQPEYPKYEIEYLKAVMVAGGLSTKHVRADPKYFRNQSDGPVMQGKPIVQDDGVRILISFKHNDGKTYDYNRTGLLAEIIN